MIINEGSGKVTLVKEDLSAGMSAVTVSDTPGSRVGRWEIEFKEGAGNTGLTKKIIQYFTVVGPPVFTTVPDIVGTYAVGSTLSLSEPPVATDTVSFSYQWKSNGVDIAAATGTTLLLTSAEEGETISLEILATGYGGQTTPRLITGNIVNSIPVITNAGTISGTRGDGLVISGTVPVATGSPAPTFTYQWQANVSGSWADIVGATSQNYTDTMLTSEYDLRRRATATNSQGSDSEFSNTLTGVPSGVASDYINPFTTKVWLDTAGAGSTLTVFENPMIGATYSVTMEAQQGWSQPAAGTLEVFGNTIRAPAGLTAVNPGTYLVTLTNNLTGSVCHQFVDVLSNKAADYTVSDIAGLNSALSTISGQITADPAAFPGRVIDMQPGVDFGDIIIDIPRLAQTKMVILRSADTNRSGGAMPSFTRMRFAKSKNVGFQRLAGRVVDGATLTSQTFFMTESVGSTAENTWISHCDISGGDIAPNGASNARVRNSIASVSNWSPMISYFQGSGPSGSINRIDLYIGHLNDQTEVGSAIGSWKAATIPAYVGTNTPTGSTGVFDMIGYDIWPTTAVEPPGWDAKFEVAI